MKRITAPGESAQPINCRRIFKSTSGVIASENVPLWRSNNVTQMYEGLTVRVCVCTVIFDRDQIAFHLFPLVQGIVCKGNRG